MPDSPTPDTENTSAPEAPDPWLVDIPSPETRPLMIGADSRVVMFEHRFFSMFKDAYFRMAEPNDEPVMVMQVDETEMALPFKSLMREFEIKEDSPDGEMLALIEDSLDYVNFLRVGDVIPKEVLTGEASWDVPEHIRRTAYMRLTIGLVSWLSGGAVRITGSDDITQLVERPEIRESINQALGEAAKELGYGKKNKAKVVERLEDLADQIARIDALRHRFEGIRMIHDKIHTLTSLYRGEPVMVELVVPVARLITSAVKDYEEYLERADTEVDDVMTLLMHMHDRKEVLSEIRNDLYCRLMAWDEMLVDWHRVTVRPGAQIEALLRKTYRFLAQRFLQKDEWVLMSKLIENEMTIDDEGAVAWYMSEDQV